MEVQGIEVRGHLDFLRTPSNHPIKRLYSSTSDETSPLFLGGFHVLAFLITPHSAFGFGGSGLFLTLATKSCVELCTCSIYPRYSTYPTSSIKCRRPLLLSTSVCSGCMVGESPCQSSPRIFRTCISYVPYHFSILFLQHFCTTQGGTAPPIHRY